MINENQDLPNIVSFSGGQTSGFMLRRLIDANPDFNERFRVVFENTGKEHEKTLDFVNRVQTRWGIPIVWLEYCRVPAVEIDAEMIPEGRMRSNHIKKQESGDSAHWFKIVNYETAARRFDKTTPFDELLAWAGTLPNVRTRMCSVQLKVRTRDRYLRSIGVEKFHAYIGIRKDEEHRKWEILANIDKYEMPKFPLCDQGITKADVDFFWNQNDFKLEIPNHMGNCDLCFLKAKWKRVAAAKADPRAAEWWDSWERKFAEKTFGDGAFFRKGQSYASIISESIQPDLFQDQDEDVACSCAIGSYRMKDKDEEIE